MAKHKLIKLSKAKIIFPAKNTRMRSHDLLDVSIRHLKHLTIKEQKALQHVASEIRYGKLFGENADILITRQGKGIKIVPFN